MQEIDKNIEFKIFVKVYTGLFEIIVGVKQLVIHNTLEIGV